jgi:adenine/guanine phosphoribosyltransferase-like PRPP-binding protein
MFRQYVNQGEVHPCIIVDDIIRSGNAIEETVELVKSLGGESSAAARLCVSLQRQ